MACVVAEKKEKAWICLIHINYLHNICTMEIIICKQMSAQTFTVVAQVKGLDEDGLVKIGND